jgi:cytochrome c-type biogenesis protein
MPQEQVSLLIAFTAGVVSFVSPCVLPLIPAYITNLSGVSMTQQHHSAGERALVMFHALAFVLGFSAIFLFLWVSVGLMGYLVQGYLSYIRIAGGAILIFMGLHTMGVWRLPLLDREVRGSFPRGGGPGYRRSFLTGTIFAAGWTPCIGPVLAGIIGLAALRETVWQGTYLLVAYSAGLAIPFLATALALNPALKALRSFGRYQRWVTIFSGAFLILIGLLMLTNMFILIPRYFYWGAI